MLPLIVHLNSLIAERLYFLKLIYRFMIETIAKTSFLHGILVTGTRRRNLTITSFFAMEIFDVDSLIF